MVVATCLINYLLLIVQTIITSKVYQGEVSTNSLESGFENLKAKMFISAPFLFLAVLFVLFDLELLLLLPGLLTEIEETTMLDI